MTTNHTEQGYGLGDWITRKAGEFNPNAFRPRFWSPRNLKPDITVETLLDVDSDDLVDRGVRAMLIDCDGVFAAYHQDIQPPDEYKDKIAALAAQFDVGILSNRRGSLLASAKSHLPDVPVFGARPLKPHARTYLESMASLGSAPGETALIEDRLVTGIAGGNAVDMVTVWVSSPLTQGIQEPPSVRMYRATENRLLGLYERLGL